MSRILGVILGAIAAIGTAGYLWWWIANVDWSRVRDLPPNELGDFLGGSFGPLAFFWLVLGFIQQGIELRQNSAALRIQADELKNAVDQQRRLVEIAGKELATTQEAFNLQLSNLAEERAELERASTPRFVLKPEFARASQSLGHIWSVSFSNAGGDCTNIELLVDGPMQLQGNHFHYLGRGSRPVEFTINALPVPGTRALLRISYVDNRQRPWAGVWEMTIDNEKNLRIVSAN